MNSLRAAAGAGAATSVALGVWMLVTARLALQQGVGAGEALCAAPAALPLTQLLAVLLCGPVIVAGRTLPCRLLFLAVTGFAPAPLLSLLYAMNATSTAELATGQLGVVAGAVFVAVAGIAAERLARGRTLLAVAVIQSAGLLLLWTLRGALPGGGCQ